MELNLFFEKGIFNKSFSKKKFKDSLTEISGIIFSSENAECNELNIKFISDKEIIKFNTKYLAHDYVTDIITFKYDLETGFDSDIVISPETVKRNAKNFDVSFETELYSVVIHGKLHLCGFDDATTEEKKIMRKNENKYLKYFSK